MPAIRIAGRDYEEIAIRQIRDPIQTSITSIALPTGAATEATLAQVRDAIKATIDLESTIWTDNSGAYYVRRDSVNEGTGVITITWTAPDGTPATPGAGLRPLATAERDVTQELFVATSSGTGYTSGDFLARLLIVDVNPTTPVVTQVWYNLSTGAVIAAPNSAHVTPSDESITVASSALPTGAATEAKQDAGNTSLASLDTKLPSSLTVSGTRLLVDGSGVTQPVSASSLPLPSGLTVSSTRLLVDGSGVTQPVSASSLPLPSGAATAANQATANSSLGSLDTKLPSSLTVSGTRLLVDGSGVTQPVSASSLPLPSGLTVSSTRLLVDGSGVTQPVSASSLPLPSGLTVSGTRLLVDGSGVTQPVSVASRTPTTTSVSSSASSGLILALNSNRKGFSISNISTAKLYLSFSNPATVANCFIEIPASGFLLLDQQLIVTNAIYGIWASANGAAQVTEYV